VEKTICLSLYLPPAIAEVFPLFMADMKDVMGRSFAFAVLIPLKDCVGCFHIN